MVWGSKYRGRCTLKSDLASTHNIKGSLPLSEKSFTLWVNPWSESLDTSLYPLSYNQINRQTWQFSEPKLLYGSTKTKSKQNSNENRQLRVEMQYFSVAIEQYVQECLKRCRYVHFIVQPSCSKALRVRTIESKITEDCHRQLLWCWCQATRGREQRHCRFTCTNWFAVPIHWARAILWSNQKPHKNSFPTTRLIKESHTGQTL